MRGGTEQPWTLHRFLGQRNRIPHHGSKDDHRISSRREEFTEWAESLGFAAEQVEIAEPGWAWGVLVTDPDEAGIGPAVAAQVADDKDRVTIQTVLSISPQHKKALLALPEQERELFASELRAALHTLHIASSLTITVDQASEEERDVRVTLADQLIDGDLTRANFFKALRRLGGASDTTCVMFSRLATRGECS